MSTCIGFFQPNSLKQLWLLQKFYCCKRQACCAISLVNYWIMVWLGPIQKKRPPDFRDIGPKYSIKSTQPPFLMFSRSCLPPLPELACNLHSAWGQKFSRALYSVVQKNSSMFEFPAFLLPTNLGQPMHSPSALTEHVSLNLAWFFFALRRTCLLKGRVALTLN